MLKASSLQASRGELIVSSIASKYCGDYKDDFGIIFLKGPGKKLVNMDVDCDGAQNKTSKAHDGRCGSSEDTQSITSFQDTIQGYKKGPKDLDAYIQPYVVFGNEGSKPHWATFNPEDYGIEPLSIIAVVCGDELVGVSQPPMRVGETVSANGDIHIDLWNLG